MEILPLEIHEIIFTQLPSEDLIRARCISKYFQKFILKLLVQNLGPINILGRTITSVLKEYFNQDRLLLPWEKC